MKQLLIYLAALICELLGLGIAWTNRATIGSSVTLLTFVGFFVVLGFLLALKTDTEAALGAIVKLRLRPGDMLNGDRSTDTQIVVTPAKPKDGAA